MDRDIQNMGRASRGEGRREGEGNTNGHSSGAGHEKESRTSQWTVMAGGRGEGARREGVHRPPGARCRREPGGPGAEGAAAGAAGGGGGAGAGGEPGEGRGGGNETRTGGERREEREREKAGRQAGSGSAPPLEKPMHQ